MAFDDISVTRINLQQGQARVSAQPDVEFSTVLGSCVCTCLHDPEARVGGMNHFLLAEPQSAPAEFDEHYGVYLMELLINEMLVLGAARHRLTAHLYGGASLIAGYADGPGSGLAGIGTRNAAFARRFLATEGIAVMREALGGTQARRIDFRPARGHVRHRLISHATPIERVMPAMRNGDVELFQPREALS